jgi:4-carboxymuconolactone decarboxylase
MRLAPLPADQWSKHTREALDGLIPAHRRNPEGTGAAIATLVRHPDLARAYLQFSDHLLRRSTLPARVRELAILRVAHYHSCSYEWGHHVAIGKSVGLSDSDISAVQDGEPAGAFDRAVLDAVDELHDKSRITDGTWLLLGERLDERQLMDLVFTVGGYDTLAIALNTFGVEPEAVERDEEEYGAAFRNAGTE